MHRFYKRIKLVFKYAGSNRSQFCRKLDYNYQTLQTYWNTNKLPPGNVLEDLAREYNVSLDALVMGVAVRPVAVENPVIREISRSLELLGKDDLLKVQGALRMFDYLNRADGGETDRTVNATESDSANAEDLNDNAAGRGDTPGSPGPGSPVEPADTDDPDDEEWATLEAVDGE